MRTAEPREGSRLGATLIYGQPYAPVPYGRSPTSPKSLGAWRLVWLVPSPHVSDVTSPGSGSPSVTSLIWFPSRHLIWFPSSIKQYSILS